MILACVANLTCSDSDGPPTVNSRQAWCQLQSPRTIGLSQEHPHSPKSSPVMMDGRLGSRFSTRMSAADPICCLSVEQPGSEWSFLHRVTTGRWFLGVQFG